MSKIWERVQYMTHQKRQFKIYYICLLFNGDKVETLQKRIFLKSAFNIQNAQFWLVKSSIFWGWVNQFQMNKICEIINFIQYFSYFLKKYIRLTCQYVVISLKMCQNAVQIEVTNIVSSKWFSMQNRLKGKR